MKGVNKAILFGNVGKDPVLYEGDFKSVSFSLATSEKYKNKDGELIEAVEWHNIVFYGVLCDTLMKYVKKGDPLFIEGKIRTRKSEKEGVTRYNTEVIGHTFNMIPKGNKEQASKPDQEQQAGAGDLPF